MNKMDEMIIEAVERLILMEAKNIDIERFREEQIIPVYFVNHEERKIIRASLNQEQKSIIADLEKDGEQIVYYAIIDRGMWPDGCTFERCCFLTVERAKTGWKFIKEQGIKGGFVPAYIYNCEVPDYSGVEEMPFKNMNGIIINIA